MASARRIRWGILGSAAINEALIPGAQAAEDADLVAIASRRPGIAEQAAARWGIPRWHDSYEALLSDPDVEAVYIPLPNHLHAEWTIRAADAGKHVLCEKPLALAIEEVIAMRDAGRRNGVHIMEAFMYRFLPRWREAERVTWSGAIGDPRVVRIGFAFFHHIDGYNIRFDPDVGGGIIWDMGCYAVNMARMLLRAEPVSVFAVPHSHRGTEVETSVEMILRFPEDRAAVAHCSFDYTNPYSQAEVVGTEGWMALPGTGFRREPVTYILHHHYRDPNDEIFLGGSRPQVIEFPPVDPYRLEVEHLSACVATGQEPRYTLDDALANTRALLAVHESAREGREVLVE
jgi:predicted dehydrogenase